jgi:hypothetical protein
LRKNIYISKREITWAGIKRYMYKTGSMH